MRPVRFVSSVPALAYDSNHDVVLKVVRSVDDRGRVWEEYGDGGPVLVQSPLEPQTKRTRKQVRKSS